MFLRFAASSQASRHSLSSSGFVSESKIARLLLPQIRTRMESLEKEIEDLSNELTGGSASPGHILMRVDACIEEKQDIMNASNPFEDGNLIERLRKADVALRKLKEDGAAAHQRFMTWAECVAERKREQGRREEEEAREVASSRERLEDASSVSAVCVRSMASSSGGGGSDEPRRSKDGESIRDQRPLDGYSVRDVSQRIEEARPRTRRNETVRPPFSDKEGGSVHGRPESIRSARGSHISNRMGSQSGSGRTRPRTAMENEADRSTLYSIPLSHITEEEMGTAPAREGSGMSGRSSHRRSQRERARPGTRSEAEEHRREIDALDGEIDEGIDRSAQEDEHPPQEIAAGQEDVQVIQAEENRKRYQEMEELKLANERERMEREAGIQAGEKYKKLKKQEKSRDPEKEKKEREKQAEKARKKADRDQKHKEREMDIARQRAEAKDKKKASEQALISISESRMTRKIDRKAEKLEIRSQAYREDHKGKGKEEKSDEKVDGKDKKAKDKKKEEDKKAKDKKKKKDDKERLGEARKSISEKIEAKKKQAATLRIGDIVLARSQSKAREMDKHWKGLEYQEELIRRKRNEILG